MVDTHNLPEGKKNGKENKTTTQSHGAISGKNRSIRIPKTLMSTPNQAMLGLSKKAKNKNRPPRNDPTMTYR